MKTEAFNYLEKIKETHSKVRSLKYSELKLQPFLASNQREMTIKEKQFAVAVQTQMLDLKTNFKLGTAETKCRRCEREEETQEHLLFCPALRDGGVVTHVPQYKDLLGEETQKIIIISRIIASKFNQFVKTPCAPSSCAAT